MDVSSISRSRGVYSVDPRQVAQSSSNSTSVDPAPARVSRMGSLMGELQQLSQSDPAKFKQAMSEIADKLKANAGDASGRADFLNGLADKFRQASEAGDMSAFKPPEGSQGAHSAHHHPHGKHASASYSAASQQSRPAESVEQVIAGVLQDVGASAA